MSIRAKTILAVLIAITLAGVGYFFIKPKSEILPSVNTAPPQTEEIDTSDWQTYRNETLGFEIKMPKDIGADDPQIGSQPNSEDEFWREQVGSVRFLKHQVGFPQFRVRVKDSDLTMDEFAGGIPWNQTIINNLPVRRRKVEQTNLGKIRFGEFIVIKNGRRYYDIDFSSGFDNSMMIEKIEVIWNTILSTFKPIP